MTTIRACFLTCVLQERMELLKELTEKANKKDFDESIGVRIITAHKTR